MECVPGTLARRKRRFPERALLQRIRYYEQLLQQNHVRFEPLHGYAAGGENAASQPSPGSASEDEHPEAQEANATPPPPAGQPGKDYERR